MLNALPTRKAILAFFWLWLPKIFRLNFLFKLSSPVINNFLPIRLLLNFSKLLLTSSEDLNEMVLNFVGVDYLKKLEANLPSVQTELSLMSKEPLTG